MPLISSPTITLIIRFFDVFIPGGLDQFSSIWLSINFSIALNSFLLGIFLLSLLLSFNFCSESSFSFSSKLFCESKGSFSLAKFFNKSSNFSSLEFLDFSFSFTGFFGFISYDQNS